MNRVHAMVLVGLLATGIAGVPAGQPTTGSGGFSELQRVEVADANDLEVVMGLITRPADSLGAKHYHPNGEFGFILKGGVTVETEHEPNVTLNAGASFYQPPGEWHVVSTTTEGAETVVFRVLKKGQPMVVTVD